LKEECGIEISFDDLCYLGRIMASPGGTDEIIFLYSVEKLINDKKLESLMKKSHGDKHENIKLKVSELNWENIFLTEDSKLICAATMYSQKNEGRIR
jgi:ADP-sugar diphosphatase